jgi:hypothetical protein
MPKPTPSNPRGAGRKPTGAQTLNYRVSVWDGDLEAFLALPKKSEFVRDAIAEKLEKENSVENYELITGPFAGEVVEEGAVLDVPFSQLDEDMQARVRDHAGEGYEVGGVWDRPVHLNDAVEDYENEWQSKPTTKPITMKPLSYQIEIVRK